MIKKISKLKDVKPLNKDDQKKINGGIVCGCVYWDPSIFMMVCC